jgi:hypothetical protein
VIFRAIEDFFRSVWCPGGLPSPARSDSSIISPLQTVHQETSCVDVPWIVLQLLSLGVPDGGSKLAGPCRCQHCQAGSVLFSQAFDPHHYPRSCRHGSHRLTTWGHHSLPRSNADGVSMFRGVKTSRKGTAVPATTCRQCGPAA